MSVHHHDRSECTLSPPLDDLDLIAALDDEIDTSIRAHLRECPSCAARANDIAGIQRAFQQRLYRMFCPSSEKLLSFQQRMINPEHYIAIANHIGECPHCARELGFIERAMANTSVSPSIGLFPHHRIALTLERRALFPNTTSASLSHSYQSLGNQYIYRADRIRLMLSIERTFGQPNRSIVNGMLSVGSHSTQQPGITASLLLGEQILSSSLIDIRGCFTIEDVPPGEVTLSLRLQDCEVVVDSLKV